MRSASVILQEINALIKPNPPTYNDPENSMLSKQDENIYLEVFQTQIKPHYKKQFEEMGGADEVLKKLEEYIAKKINALNNDNAGDLARSSPAYRTEINGVLGNYHTALRALLDKEPTVTWPSLIHKGSLQKVGNEYLRDILAYYFLTAIDPNMDIPEGVDRDAHIESSMAIFIGALCDIRRAHNPNFGKNGGNGDGNVDDPSCLPGTLGRALPQAASFNPLSHPFKLTLEQVIRPIQEIIIALFQQAHTETKQALFYYINNTLIDEDISADDKNKTFEFIEQTLNKIKPDGFNYRLLDGFPKQNLSNNIKAYIAPKLKELAAIELKSLKLEGNNGLLLNANFAERLLNIAASSIFQTKVSFLMEESIIEHYLAIRLMTHELKVLTRIVDLDLARYWLADKLYAEMEHAKVKLTNLNTQFYNYFKKLARIKEDLDKRMSEANTTVRTELKEFNAMVPPDMNVVQLQHLQLSNKHLNRLTNRVAKLNENLFSLVSKVDTTITTEQRVACLKGKYKTSTQEDWLIAHIQHILSDREEDGSLVEDGSELNWLALLMNHQAFDQLLKAKIINKLNLYLNSLPADCPQRALLDKHLQLTPAIFPEAILEEQNNTLQKERMSSTYQEIVDDSFKSFPEEIHKAVFDMTATEIFAKYQGDQAQSVNQKKWFDFIDAIAGNLEDPMALKRIKQFVLLTFIRSLKIEEIRNHNIKALEYLCDAYLKKEVSEYFQSTTLPFKKNLYGLSCHIACLLTTVNSARGLFNAGHLCLLSGEITTKLLGTNFLENDAIKDFLKKKSVVRACIIRISLTLPGAFVVTVLTIEKEKIKIKEYRVDKTDFQSKMMHHRFDNQDCIFSSDLEQEIKLITRNLPGLYVTAAIYNEGFVNPELMSDISHSLAPSYYSAVCNGYTKIDTQIDSSLKEKLAHKGIWVELPKKAKVAQNIKASQYITINFHKQDKREKDDDADEAEDQTMEPKLKRSRK